MAASFRTESPGVHTLIERATHALEKLTGAGALLAALLPSVADLLVGVVAGALILAIVMLVKRLRAGQKPVAH